LNSSKVFKIKEKAGIFQPAVCIGEQEPTKIGPKSVININFFLGHRSEILAMKEQVKMIRSLLAA
jgi:hypothetical protein